MRADPVWRVASALATSPAACPACVRIAASALMPQKKNPYALARLWASESSTRPNSWLA